MFVCVHVCLSLIYTLLVCVLPCGQIKVNINRNISLMQSKGPVSVKTHWIFSNVFWKLMNCRHVFSKVIFQFLLICFEVHMSKI